MSCEFTLKEFFAALLKRWRMLLILGLAFAVLVGGYRAFTLRGAQAAQADGTQTRADAELELENYWTQVAMAKDSIARAEWEQLSFIEYYDNSILMQLDPYNIRETTLSVSVRVETELPEQTAEDGQNAQDSQTAREDQSVSRARRILSQYAHLLETMPLSETLGMEGTQDKYLREVVLIDEGRADVLSVQVMGTPETDTAAMARACYAYLQRNVDKVEALSGAHTLLLMGESTTIAFREEVLKEQAAKLSAFTNQSAALEKNKEALEALEKEEPEAKVEAVAPSMAKILLSCVKYAVLGLLIGVFFGVLLCCLRIMAGGRIPDGEKLQRMSGLRYLGSLRAVASRKGLDALARRMAGESMGAASEADALALLCAGLSECAAESKTLLLTGTLPKAELEALAAKLGEACAQDGFRFTVGAELFSDPDSVRALHEAQGVLLAEREDVSSIDGVERELRRIREAGKPVVGFVLV